MKLLEIDELYRLRELNAELLEALRAMLARYDGRGNPRNAVTIKARAAIAKATNENP